MRGRRTLARHFSYKRSALNRSCHCIVKLREGYWGRGYVHFCQLVRNAANSFVDFSPEKEALMSKERPDNGPSTTGNPSVVFPQ